PGLGGEHNAAVSPLGGPGGALTGAAGALLAPGLDAAAGDLGAGQGALGALTAVGQVILDHLVHNRLVGLDPEHSCGELHFADLRAGHIYNSCLRHLVSLLSYLLRAEAFWGLTRAEAFCGLMLALAAAPFSLTLITELRRNTMPPLGPGMAPRTARMPSS